MTHSNYVSVWLPEKKEITILGKNSLGHETRDSGHGHQLEELRRYLFLSHLYQWKLLEKKTGCLCFTNLFWVPINQTNLDFINNLSN